MSRKFKVWDKEQNKFLELNWQNEDDRFTTGKANINVTSEGEIYFTISNKTDEDGWPYEVDADILQYTGLKDKNGKEIYEGDIITCDRNINDVFDKTTFQVLFSPQDGSYGESKRGNTVYAESFDLAEVIGNIYENPELLGK